MLIRRFAYVLLLVSAFGQLFAATAPASTSSSRRIDLKTGWSIISSAKLKDSGEAISSPRYRGEGWIKAQVPTTVLAAQVASGEFKEPYFGMNLRNIPGTSYPIGEEYSRLPIPSDSPYAASWWYRTSFVTPHGGKGVSIHFEGINYRANVWVNGKKIAHSRDVAGAYRRYNFDISPLLKPNGNNAVAVEVFAPSEKELGINWVDWNPAPPDKDMGLWGDVYLTVGGAVEVLDPAVQTHFADSSLAEAELTVVADLWNRSQSPVKGDFVAKLSDLNIQAKKEVELAAGERKAIVLTSQDFPQLKLKNPAPWWPAQMGTPKLHSMSASFVEGSRASDEKQVRYGIREITADKQPNGALLFKVNGKNILIRGGGWAPDMMLRQDSRRLRAEFDYVRDMNLNTIRLEGKMESKEFFDLADERGILVMAGWCCCDIWEQWDKWQDGQLQVATESVRSQISRLRAHPSMLVWLNGSDNPPPAEIEKAYLQVEKELMWPNPILSSATAQKTTVTGASGVKMTGPYDFVLPSYWLIDKDQRGGAYGFNTETSPGAAIPTENSLAKFLPKDSLWPQNDVWKYHAGSEGFKDLHLFNDAMNASYNPPKDLIDYERKSQAMTYDGERAMFEAYSRNKYNSTGVIQWMLNNAWPSLIWHLYDYYLQPAGGYFGTKKANEPLHIQYSYDNQNVDVVNSTYSDANKLKASINVFDFDLKPLYTGSKEIDVPADSVKTALALSEILRPEALSTTYFVQLSLSNAEGKPVSRNFYWLSTKKPEFVWAKTTYISTPITSYDDFKALEGLPKTQIRAALVNGAKVGGERTVKLTNSSKQLAFQLRLAMQDAEGNEILPVLWEDNYVTLVPGEEREIGVRFPEKGSATAARLVVSGWNIDPVKVPVRATVSKGAAGSEQ